MHFSELGFDSYDEYLDSPEWKEIRDIMYHSGVAYRCRLCHATKNLRLHKRTYFNLTAKFFYYLLKNNRRLFFKILVYLCPRCNTLVHWYDGKKMQKKVPLDYLFLWDREQQVYRRIDLSVIRFYRTTARFLRWMRDSYRVDMKKRRIL